MTISRTSQIPPGSNKDQGGRGSVGLRIERFRFSVPRQTPKCGESHTMGHREEVQRFLHETTPLEANTLARRAPGGSMPF